jgi:hypothetical protein
MKRLLFLTMLPLILYNSSSAQGLMDAKRDYYWLFSWAGPNLPLGGGVLDFNTSPVCTSLTPSSQIIFVTSASICNSKGELLSYSNGFQVSDKSHNIMQHGDSINPGTFFSSSIGNTIPGGAIMLPCPGDSSLVYLVHQKYEPDTSYTLIIPGLYYSLIDLKLNNGLGDVVTKERNIPILLDTLDISISAVRHANGRDWWILVAEFPTSVIHKFLLDPRGIEDQGSQAIGNSFPQMSFGFNIFTPNGTKFIRSGNCGSLIGGLWRIEIFDFNRCTGYLFNERDVSYISNDSAMGLWPAVSANSQFLYISTLHRVYQFDLNAIDIGLSKQTVACFDGFHDPTLTLPTFFSLPQLGPDGKIYIAVDHNTPYVHYINHPDLAGLACEVKQHALTLPVLYGLSTPYFPNFRLGRLVGSPCDTLDWTGMEDEFPSQSSRLTAYPTPASDLLTIEIDRIDQSTAQTLVIFDALGRKIEELPISPFQSIIRVDVKLYKNGLYLGYLGNNRTITGTIKFSVQR